MIAMLAAGCRVYGDGDQWVKWWVFPTMSDAIQYVEGLAVFYGGPGRTFANRPSVRESRAGWVLVRQRGGWDI